MTFTLTPSEGAPLPVNEEGEEVSSVELEEAGTVSFGKLSFTSEDAGNSYTYTVTERAEGFETGWTAEPEEVEITVTVSEDAESGELSVEADPENLTAVFTNTFKSSTVQFFGKKTLNGRKLENAEFRFTLTDSEGNLIESVRNAANGSIAFSPITYTEEGTYTYTVKEAAGSENGMTYDSREYTITVTVTEDADGVLSAEVSGADRSGLNFEFENEYRIVFYRLTPSVPTLPETGFTSVHAQVLPQQPASVNYKPLRWRIEIPTLAVSTDIVEVPSVDDRYPVTWLGTSAGLLEGSSLPGRGRSLITGHNHLNTMEAGPFAMLWTLSEGDRIFVTDPDDELSVFEVYLNEKISEYDIDGLRRISESDAYSLTLITCEDERTSGGYDNRRIIAARPVM